MDTVHPEDSTCILPSARELLLHVDDHPASKSSLSPSINGTSEEPNSADKMQIDEPLESLNSREPLLHNDQDSITKPHLPSITNAQPCSPIPHASSPSRQQQQQQQQYTNNNNSHMSDEYLRHRMSDMSVSSVSSPPQHPHHHHHNPHQHQQQQQQRGVNEISSSPRAMSPVHELSGRERSGISPLEPTQQSQQPYYESYSRRGSITDPMLHNNNNNNNNSNSNTSSSTSTTIAPPLEFRRPSITDLNNLPLPTSSASASRRGSMATVITDYDYPSRSPSPSPFAKRGLGQHESDYINSRRDSLPHPGVPQSHHPQQPQHHQQSYDPFQRRHSIATAEVPPSNRLASNSKYRAFRFPATIPETPSHGAYSAPSSPPHSGNIPSSFENSQSASMATSSNDAQRYPRHGAGSNNNSNSRYASPSSGNNNDHPYPYHQRSSAGHPYANGNSTTSTNNNNNSTIGGGPLLHHRRRSILMDEGIGESGPVLARRASMPVVGMQGNLHHHPNMHHRHPHHDSIQNDGYHTNYSNNNGAASHNHPHSYHQHGNSSTEEERSLNRKGETPYSRSPELRVSHKLAERKRRKEMKELFDELRDSLPVEKNLKTSKWEILSKAVEYISLLKRRDFEMENEVSALRREVSMLKRDREGNNGYGPPY